MEAQARCRVGDGVGTVLDIHSVALGRKIGRAGPSREVREGGVLFVNVCAGGGLHHWGHIPDPPAVLGSTHDLPRDGGSRRRFLQGGRSCIGVALESALLAGEVDRQAPDCPL